MYPKIVNVLLYLINLSFEKGIFPDILKTAVVIPLHKSGPNNDCNNFRPISLLSTFAKIFEKIMKKRLVKFLEQTHFFSKNQFGFREGLSTETALKNFMDDVLEAINSGRKVSGLFLDIKKAFDTVDHDILLNKLYCCGIRGNVLSWFSSYLNNRRQCVKISNTFSDFGIIKSGVPQGSVLGAILFIVYINDLCNSNLYGRITSFADDTALTYIKDDWNDIEEAMSIDLKALQWWFSKNNMLLSPEKTKYINFSLKKDPQHFTKQILYNCVSCLCTNKECPECAIVSQSDNLKYLGILLDREINWKKHIDMVKKKLNGILRTFYFLQNMCTEEVMRMLYFSLVNSRLEYGIFCWGGTYETNLKPLLMQQKKFIRLVKRKCRYEPSHPLFISLNIFPITYLFVYKVLKIFYVTSGNLPVLINIYKNKLRHKDKIAVPKPNLTIFRKSYCFLGPKMFNTIPKDISNSKNIHIFSKLLKLWLLSKQNINCLLHTIS
ncbi:hypothetical protein J6590_108242 [Homalodisca vitripennis]|nr:hypothetical protein J6590_108242 [Homalodisca vitripennis]